MARALLLGVPAVGAGRLARVRSWGVPREEGGHDHTPARPRRRLGFRGNQDSLDDEGRLRGGKDGTWEGHTRPCGGEYDADTMDVDGNPMAPEDFPKKESPPAS